MSRIDWIKDVNDQEMKALLKQADRDAVLTCRLGLKFNPQIDVLTGTLFVTVFSTGGNVKEMIKAESPYEKPILKFQVIATDKLANSVEDINVNGSRWAENGGAILRIAIDKILNQLSLDLDKALQNPSHVIE